MSGRDRVSATTGNLLGLDPAEGEMGVGGQDGDDHTPSFTHAFVFPVIHPLQQRMSIRETNSN